jgi:hypothetical protein
MQGMEDMEDMEDMGKGEGSVLDRRDVPQRRYQISCNFATNGTRRLKVPLSSLHVRDSHAAGSSMYMAWAPQSHAACPLPTAVSSEDLRRRDVNLVVM